LKVAKHSSPNYLNRCDWCGALAINGQFGPELSCIPHEAPAPEPQSRKYDHACEDQEVISQRIAELYAERTAMVNHVDEDSGVTASEQEVGDCCG
jgi:hypothetical protein